MTESIFADIIKSYQYSSEHARMKEEQRNKRYMQEQKEAEISYLNNYKDLVPYSGGFIYGALKSRSIQGLVSSAEYDSRTAGGVSTKKLTRIESQLSLRSPRTCIPTFSPATANSSRSPSFNPSVFASPSSTEASP